MSNLFADVEPPTSGGRRRADFSPQAAENAAEWGVPVHDDRRLFEFPILEGAQAGRSWDTVLRKRDPYRTVFDGFDPATQ
jgi:3-methyladenine DNA glycosylase Tag